MRAINQRGAFEASPPDRIWLRDKWCALCHRVEAGASLEPGTTNYTYNPRGHGKFILLHPLLLRSHKFPYCDMETGITDVSQLLCVTGFIAEKTISHTECKKCTDILGSVGKPLQLFVDEKSHKYFDLNNRDGLTLSDPGYFVSLACRGWYKKTHPYYFNNEQWCVYKTWYTYNIYHYLIKYLVRNRKMTYIHYIYLKIETSQ